MILESVLAFIGLIVGVFLARFTKEEFKTGKKYFILICRVVLFILIIYLLYLVEINWLLLGFVLGAFVGYFFRNVYFYLGLGVFSLNVYFAFLVFLFGLLYGTLIYHVEKVWRKVLFSFIWFVLGAFILLVDISNTFIYSFVAGALFMHFLRRIG
ncbi:hypothetical protein K8R33_03815 [archaeon]|nr:hypothetical protein [archaeon]